MVLIKNPNVPRKTNIASNQDYQKDDVPDGLRDPEVAVNDSRDQEDLIGGHLDTSVAKKKENLTPPSQTKPGVPVAQPPIGNDSNGMNSLTDKKSSDQVDDVATVGTGIVAPETARLETIKSKLVSEKQSAPVTPQVYSDQAETPVTADRGAIEVSPSLSEADPQKSSVEAPIQDEGAGIKDIEVNVSVAPAVQSVKVTPKPHSFPAKKTENDMPMYDLHQLLADSEKEFMPVDGFVVNDGGTYALTEGRSGADKKRLFLGSPCVVDHIEEDAHTATVSTYIQVIAQHKVKMIKLGPTDILPRQLAGLLVTYGASVNSAGTKIFSSYLQAMRDNVKSTQSFQDMGWQYLNEKLAFGMNTATDGEDLFGQYAGGFDLKPHGALEIWKSAVNKYIVGHPELELVFCIGFASIVAAFDSFQETPHDFSPMVINLWGKSSSGKTTAMLAALSIFGNPVPRAKGSLAATFSSTNKSMIALLRGNHGVMQAFDEVGSKNAEVDLGGLVYDMGNGTEMQRLDSDSKLQEKNGFLTFVLATGEVSLFDRLKVKPGIFARLAEFRNLNYTEDASHAESIKAQFSYNYGWGALPIAHRLMTMDNLEYRGLYDEASSYFENGGRRSEVIERFRKQMMTIIMGERLAKQVFGFEFDDAALAKNLRDAVDRQDKLLNADNAFYKQVLAWPIKHPDTVADTFEHSDDKGGFRMTYKTTGEPCLVFSEELFETIAIELGEDSAAGAAKRIKNAGGLVPEKGGEITRLTYRHKNKAGVKVNYYRIRSSPVPLP